MTTAPSEHPATAALALRFPSSFCWGVATAAFQIEGASTADGKGESIWDRFCRVPGAIADSSNGDVACDHFHRMESDLDLIASLGIDVYRFSISWPRVQPLGYGAPNEAGLSFYDRLIDGLLARGIQPCATLNHWDLPQALQEQGGWASRETVHRFVDYSRHVQARFGDRLRMLTTHNEPWVIAVLGHEQGIFAPGLKSRRIAMQVAHHLLLSHGLSLQALRADGARQPLGIVLNLAHMEPATSSAEDVAAMQRADAGGRRWYTDALFLGRYPDEVLADLGADMPRIEPGDLATIAQPLDYLGVNYYSRAVCSASGPYDVKASGLPLTDMGWEIYPVGLTKLLQTLHHEYTLPPVWITENGAAFPDVVEHGAVHDAARVDYLRTHISAVADAADSGVPVAGYMVWSLMDNFEWSSGYAKRFGIVHIDYTTQQRTLKDSAHWYRGFMEAVRSVRSVRQGG